MLLAEACALVSLIFVLSLLAFSTLALVLQHFIC